ncbi:MAG: hypothetical protein ABSE90_03425 [Verrucomicrobiota bacterium]
MSLINDALKRARESQRNNPPSGAPPLPPVESPARGGAVWILAAAAVLFLAAVGIFLGPALFGHKAPPSATAKTPGISEPPPAETAPAPAPPQVAAVPVPAPKTNTPPPPATNTNPPPAVVAVEQFPKVQGIIFNTARPLAIVNGRTVSAGDRVAGFEVKQILKSSIILQRQDGSQKTLVIGE